MYLKYVYHVDEIVQVPKTEGVADSEESGEISWEPATVAIHPQSYIGEGLVLSGLGTSMAHPYSNTMAFQSEHIHCAM